MRAFFFPFSTIGGVALLVPALLGFGAGCRSENNIITKDPDGGEDGGDGSGEVEEPFTNDWGQWLSLGVMSDGRPAAAYYDVTAGAAGFAIATVNADGSVSWDHEEPDGYPDAAGADPGDRGRYTSMAIGADGTVWMAYRDNGAKNLRYARRTPTGAWSNGVADVGGGTSSDCGMFSSIALDGSGNPVIAHYDLAEGTLRVARWSGSAFSGSVVDEGVAPTDVEGAVADVGQFPRLLISNNVEYISYFDVANGDLKLANGAGGSFTTEIVDASGNVGAWSDMKIQDGTIHLAYHDVGNEDLKYATGAPGGWTIEVVDNGQTVGADTALVMGGTSPQILYHDGRNNDLRVAWRGSDAWSSDRVTGEQGALGFHNEVVSTSGVNWVGSYDYTARTLWFSKLN